MSEEAQVAGSEIELFVESRIVGDMHLAVAPGNRTVGVEHDRGVVIDAGGAPLEQRGDDYHLARGGELAQRRSARSRNRLGELEPGDVFGLTKIQRGEQFLQTDHLRAARSRLFDPGQRLFQVKARLRDAGHLDQTQGQEFFARSHPLTLRDRAHLDLV